MKIKASGRSASIIAAGIWACVWGPLQVSETAAKANVDVARAAAAKENNAATNAALKKVAKNRARQLKKVATVRSRKPAATEPKAKTDIKLAQAEAAATDDDRTALPPSVANANAQLAAADIASGDGLLAKADKAKLAAKQDAANNSTATHIVAADELNDLDMAAADDRPKPVAAKLTEVSAASGSDDSLSKTSLIGKIFIAFGGLLTLASAARMFMA
jgi:hypothetical protein